jgi:hypothetical protein
MSPHVVNLSIERNTALNLNAAAGDACIAMTLTRCTGEEPHRFALDLSRFVASPAVGAALA